ncbi:CPBP family intramembrane glutamic endopeptidase [Amycolatopsis australiensis]|uniref:CAAX prenyl protease 2/Lysostaphin resistance protein A-like domain-containing protein n=1 Tax=Amycolatopsis australiensis TaxID=546364 RepID=A0A1K1SSH2_9PSEU|nr:CPBP family intramembrane glutamic endopeptidase [Amycolatopsis australiensis]SFW87360.1 hypothetical protein SAMN04489730_6655 [Amycolatopsis australiensis]
MRKTVLAAITAFGSGLLGASLASRPGSRRFHALTASVAATWFAGAGRVPRGRRDVVQPVAAGAGAFGVFYGGALVARHIPPLRRAITGVLDHAHRGSTPSVAATALVTGVAEEVFFRGALYDAFGARGATAVYVLSTAATRNPALVLASAVMGTVFAWQRHRSGGVQAPLLTHVTWSALMLAVMPRLFPPAPQSVLVRNASEPDRNLRRATRCSYPGTKPVRGEGCRCGHCSCCCSCSVP